MKRIAHAAEDQQFIVVLAAVNGIAHDPFFAGFEIKHQILGHHVASAHRRHDLVFAVIAGGLGADIMKGGDGNDTYVVDKLGDLVTELLNQGTDTVQSSITYALTANVENLTLTGLTAINGTGNILANTIIGNAAANIITGGGGQDVLTGDAGNDVFVFKATTDTTKLLATSDVITDFTTGADHINLAAIDANSKVLGDQAFKLLALDGAAFTGVAGQLHFYTPGTGAFVEGDINGDKVAGFQIHLNGLKTLTAADFVL